MPMPSPRISPSWRSSDPHRFAIENPSGGYEFSVGAAVLPFVRQLAHIEGPMVVVTSPEVG